MRRTLSAGACMLTLMIGTTTFARADDAAVRKTLEKQYARISQAYKDKAIKPLMDLTTPDFVMVMESGKIITRQTVEQRFSTFVTFVQSVQEAKEKINKVTVKGNEATVDVQETIKGVTGDPQTQGMTHQIGLTSHNQDTWIKAGNTWLRKKSQTLKSGLIQDGKVVDLSGVTKKVTPVPMKGKSGTTK